ncbi:MAG TPA: hypothetical protein VFS55_03870 [Dokdonella sp.]|nr:hypothetical protein [Dokdonella sp.]
MDLAAGLLPRRGVRLLALAFALAVTGTTIAWLSHGLANDAPAAEAAPVLLPTVVVHAEPEIPTLATVTVRAGDAAPGGTARPLAVPRFAPVHAVTSFASAGSAGAGFGMPYYSFGKPLRHGTEE